ncbi:biotin-dependent carboxyltransferase family protein [Pelagibacteraceae bacterium]|jgi:urea carboxylase|nr:biotin-dependent carboxyltransferase family protein [Pelagibacteraceae bacterium]|tara:strand:- start:1374 stop:2501 length:1128 start_codon:yes stop_codon:yes gene_type:complete
MAQVIKKGLETSIQDYPGRIGTLNQGFPASGPMDSWSFRLANILVGNEPGEAALECQFMGPTLKFKSDRVIAITGANMSPKIDGELIPMWESIEIKANQTLEMAFATVGARSYIAFSGGINSEPWLGSRSTFHKAGVGGIEGRAIQDNQIIPLGKNKKIQLRKIKKDSIPIISDDKNWSIEVVRGPNDDWVDEKGHEIFLNSKWKLQAKSDRTGYRLDGPKLTFSDKATNKSLEHGSEPSNIIDQGYPAGAINLAGQTPIILVNDGPSMGGFINPYTVPSSAFWKLGQAKPGDTFKFVEISVEKAQLLRAEQSIICSEESLVSHEDNKSVDNNKITKKIGSIKIVDFEKNKLEEKVRRKMMEKKGIKNMKVRFFD